MASTYDNHAIIACPLTPCPEDPLGKSDGEVVRFTTIFFRKNVIHFTPTPPGFFKGPRIGMAEDWPAIYPPEHGDPEFLSILWCGLRYH